MAAAEQQALREAADTGGIILRVKSLTIERHRALFTGLIPSIALVFQHPSEFPAYLQPRWVGNLHLTEGSFHPGVGGDVGYLVLQTPVATAGLLPESEDGDLCWVALAVERACHALPPVSIGAVCCARCHRPIAQQRLMAVPNTRFCTYCQQEKEKE
jgi:hypothetical protein